MEEAGFCFFFFGYFWGLLVGKIGKDGIVYFFQYLYGG
jgi:hypothetical protein